MATAGSGALYLCENGQGMYLPQGTDSRVCPDFNGFDGPEFFGSRFFLQPYHAESTLANNSSLQPFFGIVSIIRVLYGRELKCCEILDERIGGTHD
jgi:hypothetical protein